MSRRNFYRSLIGIVVVLAVGGAFLLGRVTAPRVPEEARKDAQPVAANPHPRQPETPTAEPAIPPRSPEVALAHEDAVPWGGAAGVWTFSLSGGPPMKNADGSVVAGVKTSPEPVPFGKLNVIDEMTNNVVGQVTTDKAGRFRVVLPPGRYYLDDPKDARYSLRGTASFEVVRGRYSQVAPHSTVSVP